LFSGRCVVQEEMALQLSMLAAQAFFLAGYQALEFVVSCAAVAVSS